MMDLARILLIGCEQLSAWTAWILVTLGTFLAEVVWEAFIRTRAPLLSARTRGWPEQTRSANVLPLPSAWTDAALDVPSAARKKRLGGATAVLAWIVGLVLGAL